MYMSFELFNINFFKKSLMDTKRKESEKDERSRTNKRDWLWKRNKNYMLKNRNGQLQRLQPWDITFGVSINCCYKLKILKFKFLNKNDQFNFLFLKQLWFKNWFCFLFVLLSFFCEYFSWLFIVVLSIL